MEPTKQQGDKLEKQIPGKDVEQEGAPQKPPMSADMRRPTDERKKPLSFVCADLADITQCAKVSNFAYKVLRRLTPGPYTFILEATKVVPEIMTTRQKQVALRIPDSPITQALVRGLGRPLLSTS